MLGPQPAERIGLKKSNEALNDVTELDDEAATLYFATDSGENALKKEIVRRLTTYVNRVTGQDLNRMLQAEVVEENQTAVLELFLEQLELLDDLFSARNVLVMKSLRWDNALLTESLLPRLRFCIRSLELTLRRHSATFFVTVKDLHNNELVRRRQAQIRRGGAVEWVVHSHLGLIRLIWRGLCCDARLLDAVRPRVMLLSFDARQALLVEGRVPRIVRGRVHARPQRADEGVSRADGDEKEAGKQDVDGGGRGRKKRHRGGSAVRL